jgi:hypothetical protein
MKNISLNERLIKKCSLVTNRTGIFRKLRVIEEGKVLSEIMDLNPARFSLFHP